MTERGCLGCPKVSKSLTDRKRALAEERREKEIERKNRGCGVYLTRAPVGVPNGMRRCGADHFEYM